MESLITNDNRYTVKLYPELPRSKQHTATRKLVSSANWTLNLKKKLVKCYIWGIALYGAEVGHFVKQITNASKVLICGAGEGWRRKAGPIA